MTDLQVNQVNCSHPESLAFPFSMCRIVNFKIYEMFCKSLTLFQWSRAASAHMSHTADWFWQISSADRSFRLFLTGTSVMSVSATDADDPMTENAFLSYSIIGQDSIPANAVTKIMFGINNQTGAIYTRDVGLDREVKCSLRSGCRFLQIIIVWFI